MIIFAATAHRDEGPAAALNPSFFSPFALRSGALAVAALFALPGAALAQTAAGTELPAVQVTGSQDGRSEGSGSYTTTGDSRGTAGLALTPRETPQSVSTITRQRMDDQGLDTIDQVLGASTGITYNQLDNGGRTTYRARGFSISNYKVDGLLVEGGSDLSSPGAAFNMDLYDRVEIVRGANGLLGGTGDPSATISFLRKRPGRSFSASAGLTLGSWASKRLTADINAPLNAEGSVRARLTVSGQDANSFRERESSNALGVLASIEADLGRDTTLRAGVQYERNKSKGSSWGTNVPIWYADGTLARLPRKTNPATNWSGADRDTRTVFAALEHRLGGGWQTELNVARTDAEAINNYGIAKVNNFNNRTYAGFWNQDGTGAMLNGLHSETESERTNLSWQLSGPFQLLDRTHQFSTGVSGYRSESTSYTFNNTTLGNCSIAGVNPYSGCQYRSVGLLVANWRLWDGSYPDFVTFRTPARSVSTVSSYGGFAAGRFNLADSLNLIVGARLSNYKTYSDTYSVRNQATRGTVSGNRQVVTPYAGVVWDLNRELSLYASYTDVFRPQTSRDVRGEYLDPVTGRSYEAGIKGEFFNGRLNTSAAVFRIDQKNIAEADGTNTTPDGAQAYVANGQGVKSNGFEVDVSGEVSPGWNLYAGYTYLRVRNPSSETRDDPRHVLRVGSTYRLPGDWSRLTVGGNVSVQSETTTEPNPGRPLGNNQYDTTVLKSPGYALVGLSARYQINRQLVATFNVDNLFDRTYYRQYGFYDGLIYGEPRRFTVGLRATF